jgi:hypothetical protein
VAWIEQWLTICERHTTAMTDQVEQLVGTHPLQAADLVLMGFPLPPACRQPLYLLCQHDLGRQQLRRLTRVGSPTTSLLRPPAHPVRLDRSTGFVLGWRGTPLLPRFYFK